MKQATQLLHMPEIQEIIDTNVNVTTKWFYSEVDKVSDNFLAKTLNKINEDNSGVPLGMQSCRRIALQ